LVNKELLKEIRFLVICSLCIDIILIAVAALFVPFVNALCGALLGTVLLTADMFFLSLTVHGVVTGAKRGRDGSKKMVIDYLTRLLFLGAGLFIAVKIPFVSIICTAIPLLYPKLVFPLRAILVKKEG